MIIGLEGIDGSGKTHLSRYLVAELKLRGIDVLLMPSKSLSMGRNDETNDLLSNKMLDFSIPEIKDLMHLSIEISASHQAKKWQEENPNGVVIFDRTWLTVLTYLAFNPYQYLKRGHLLGVLKPLMTSIVQPDFTYLLMEDFNQERVKDREELMHYYDGFPDAKIAKKYKEFVNWMIFSIDAKFKFIKSKGFENLDSRNLHILEDVLNEINLRGEIVK